MLQKTIPKIVVLVISAFFLVAVHSCTYYHVFMPGIYGRNYGHLRTMDETRLLIYITKYIILFKMVFTIFKT